MYENYYFSLQLDKSTDINNKSLLLCYVRCEYRSTVSESILFILTIVVYTTAEDIFCKPKEFLTVNKIDWTKYVEISTIGAREISKKLTGLITQIQKIIPSLLYLS